MYYVVGLGNPGKKYEQTRHNIGRMVVAELAHKESAGEFVYDKFARALRTRTKNMELVLPETFMNKSGETVDYLVKKESLASEQLIIVSDDVDLPFGTLKISTAKSHGGHNGIRDIEAVLQTRNFIKVRVGVAQTSWWSGEAKRPPATELASFVLHEFSFFEKRQLQSILKNTVAAINAIVETGVTSAMNTYNK